MKKKYFYNEKLLKKEKKPYLLPAIKNINELSFVFFLNKGIKLCYKT